LQVRGKQRLILLAVLVLALVALAALVTYPRTKRSQSSTANAATNATGGTTATADEVKALESWGLQAADLPPGTQLLQGAGELRDYAAGQGNPQAAKAIADSGRVDGLSQIWRRTTPQGQLQGQYRVYFDLYATTAEASRFIDQPYNDSSGQPLQKLPDDPKLGDASHVFAGSSSTGGGLQGWGVRWLRGRTVLSIDGIAPTGQLTEDAVLNLARTIDGRAKQAPIK